MLRVLQEGEPNPCDLAAFLYWLPFNQPSILLNQLLDGWLDDFSANCGEIGLLLFRGIHALAEILYGISAPTHLRRYKIAYPTF